MTYSVDFRKQVIKIKVSEHLSFAKVAKRFGIGINSVVRWANKIDSKRTRNKGATKIDMEVLKMDIGLYPDAYQYERAERLRVSKSCIYFALKRLKVSYKKNSGASKGGSRKTLCFLPDHSAI